MEAAATPKRELSGEKAQRIVDAMRATVGERGATGATFDVVAREAGVSGLPRRVRGHLGAILAEARDAGVIALAAAPEIVAEVLFSLADGLGMRMLAEPGRDFEPEIVAATRAAAALVS